MDIHTDNADTLNAALRLIADIREAAGDSEGKLMQDELVARIRRMREGLQSLMDDADKNRMEEFPVIYKGIAIAALNTAKYALK